MINPNQAMVSRSAPAAEVEKVRREIADRVARWLGVPACDVEVSERADPAGTVLTGHWWPAVRRWRDRACCCGHPRALHQDAPAGCQALRCRCAIFDAAWAARLWGRWHRVTTRDNR